MTYDHEKLANYVLANKINVDLDLNEFPKDASLNDLFSNKKFIFLGEPDHWINEKYSYRLKIIDFLLDHGLTHIGMELGHSDGVRYNHYLKTGHREDIEKLALYGYPVPQQGADDFSGALIDAHKDKTALSGNTYIQAEIRHANQLHALLKNKKKEITYFGFDVDTTAGGGYEDLVKLSPSEGFTKKIRKIQEMPIDDAVQSLEALLTDMGEQMDRDQALMITLKALYESLIFASVAFFKHEPELLIQTYKRREQWMFHLFDYHLQNASAKDKFVLMGHNMHLTKDYTSMKFGTTEESVALWPTIGDYIYHRFPEQTLSIWMLFNEGEHSAPSVFPEKITPKSDSIEFFLSQFGESFLLPIRSDAPGFNATQKYVCHNGDAVIGTLSEATDLIYFKNKVSKIA